MTYKDGLAFSFHIPTKIVFGVNSLKDVVKEMDGLKMEKALVVTDGTLKDSPMVKTLMETLGNRAAGLFGEVIPDSSFQVVSRGAGVFREKGADGLISIGGGSSMDTAKAIGVLAKKGKEDLREFVGIGKIGEPIVPHIAVPTTSGTASEVTQFATVKDHEAREKRLLSDPALIPPVAILDPLLTVSLPAQMTAATAMDAMSHGIESVHARYYEPVADALAYQAIRLIVQYLPVCLQKPDDLEARGMLAIASTLGGMAFQNALVGCVHGMAHALGGMYGLHHGLANSILLPHGMRFNMPLSAPRYRQVAEAFGLDVKGRSDAQVGEMTVQAVEVFTKNTGLPQKLSQVNIPRENMLEVAKLALGDPGMKSNLRRVTDPQELVPVLLAAW
jgi:alcohol dehydrogenase class IV